MNTQEKLAALLKQCQVTRDTKRLKFRYRIVTVTGIFREHVLFGETVIWDQYLGQQCEFQSVKDGKQVGTIGVVYSGEHYP